VGADDADGLCRDGVLASYDGWRGPEVLGTPIPGMGEVVAALHARGYRVVVHSTREPHLVVAWLARHDFPALQVSRTKPPAVCYLDDRALRFDGPPVEVEALIMTIEPTFSI
jgi:hypothetical protein